MSRKLVAALVATAIAAGAAVPAAHAMNMEFNMLTGAVYNALKARNLPTDVVGTLTLDQIGQIRAVLDDDSIADTNKTQRIKAIIANN